jgi:ketosteroid isomerase-like protein
MIEKSRMDYLVQRFIDGWNSHDAETLLACYADDMTYWDAATGEIVGKEAFRAYLLELFHTWQMRWTLKEAIPLGDRNGVVARWQAVFQKKRNRENSVELDGLDLVLLDGELVTRNEIYFNLGALAQLS